MQGLQHEAIAPQGDDDIGLVLGDSAIACNKRPACRLGGRGITGDKGNLQGHRGWVPFPKGAFWGGSKHKSTTCTSHAGPAGPFVALQPFKKTRFPIGNPAKFRLLWRWPNAP